MIKKFILMALLPSALLLANTQTQTNSSLAASMTSEDEAYTAYIAPTYEHFQFKSSGFGTFNGSVWGGEMGLKYQSPWAPYAHLGTSASSGKVTTKGSTSKIDLIEVNFSAHVGYTTEWGNESKFTLTAYTGFDYLWFREYIKLVEYDDQRWTYSKPMIPIGIMVDFPIFEDLSIGFHYAFQFATNTDLDIDLLSGSDWNLSNSNNQLFEIPVTYKILDCFQLAFVPFYKYIGFGGSTAATNTGLALGVNSQQNNVWGGKIEAAYRF